MGEEHETDKAKKEWCESENDKNDKEQDRTDNEQAAQDTEIAKRKEEIIAAKDAISNLQEEVRVLLEDREANVSQRREGNMLYQKDVADLTSAQHVLKQAIQALEAFYNAGEEADSSRSEAEYSEQNGAQVLDLLAE